MSYTCVKPAATIVSAAMALRRPDWQYTRYGVP